MSRPRDKGNDFNEVTKINLVLDNRSLPGSQAKSRDHHEYGSDRAASVLSVVTQNTQQLGEQGGGLFVKIKKDEKNNG